MGHCCNIVYTSGTTGDPKGVMISHDNANFACSAAMDHVGDVFAAGQPKVIHEGAGCMRLLSFLPTSHIAGFLLCMLMPLHTPILQDMSCTIYFARPYDLKDGTLRNRLEFVRPTVFAGVPRVWEKIAEKMKAIGAAGSKMQRTISTWAKKKNIAAIKAKQLPNGDGSYPRKLGVAQKIVGVAHKKLGLQDCLWHVTAAAPIMPETIEYFGSLGINILEVYGMSESTGPSLLSHPRTQRWGSIGFAPRGVETRLFKTPEDAKPGDYEYMKAVAPAKNLDAPTESEQGEICFRGRNIMMGYLCNPALGKAHVSEVEKKNKECIDDQGWCHSGDKGAMSTDGLFKITGRYKELIIGSGGESISPGITTVSQAMKDPKWKAYCENALKSVNSNDKVCINGAFKIQKYAIVPHDFSIETGELTPTQKLKRGAAEKIWQNLIDELYGE